MLTSEFKRSAEQFSQVSHEGDKYDAEYDDLRSQYDFEGFNDEVGDLQDKYDWQAYDNSMHRAHMAAFANNGAGRRWDDAQHRSDVSYLRSKYNIDEYEAKKTLCAFNMGLTNLKLKQTP